MPAQPLRVIFFGRSNEHTLSALEHVRRHHQVVGIVESLAQPPPTSRARAWLDRVPGRPSLAAVARRAALPFFRLTKQRMAGLRAFVPPLQPDVGVISSMAHLLPADAITQFPRGILNLHPSLLPSYRGPSPTVWEFWHREPEGGVTLHFIDAGEDTGDIVGQTRIPIPFGTDGAEHLRRCHREGARLVVAALDQLSAGELVARPQRHLACPFRARAIKPGQSPIDWTSTPIEQVFHLLRGALPLLDLLPPAPPALAMVRFRATSFERCVPARAPATYFVGPRGIAIAHAQGHVRLRPKLSVSRAAQVSRAWITSRRVDTASGQER
jgi:methionyl-tRNA formyltransferase